MLAIILTCSWGQAGEKHGADRTARVFTKEVLQRSGLPFIFNDLPTALPFSKSPAYADIIVDPAANFLPCQGGPFALCYYSGPDGPLPCDVTKADPIAECECIEIAYGNYYVDINAILDVDTYLHTIQACGKSGENCQTKNSAPVCAIINANKLFPGADLTSVFSFNCAREQGIGGTSCRPAVYAGCMTAPCYREPGSDTGTVQCLCPTFKGPYQVGQDLSSPKQCNLGRQNVWSAAYKVTIHSDGDGDGATGAANQVTIPTPDQCIPDDPNPDVGCPLYPVETTLTPESELCQVACQEYSQCTSGEVQVGFTCDATLCTAGCNDLALVGDACSGLEPACQTAAIIQVETMAGCSCCASQICGCEANQVTNEEIFVLNQLQRDLGIVPQCDLNDTLCGTEP